MKKLMKLVFGIIVCSLVFSISLNVKAMEKKDYYCPLCTKKKDDPLYAKERQFYTKIKIIKTVFGDSIDEVVLAATVLHKYGTNYTYNVEWTENFNESKYEDMWKNILKSFPEIVEQLILTEDEQKRLQKNEQIDLLTIATIVMLDSNHLGTYSDVCYRDGLAGEGLVGNTGDNGAFAKLANGIFCFAYQVDNNFRLQNPLEYISGLLGGDSFLVTGLSKYNRIINTKMVCENGYVGGLYNDLYKINDKDQKDILKKHRAQEIIDYANQYKSTYGSLDETQNSCPVGGGLDGNTQIGDLGSTMEERISKFGPMAQADYSRTGIYASLTIGQAIAETSLGLNSAAFNTCLAQSNNDFGCVKCRGKEGGRCINAGGDSWQFYESVEAAINDRVDLFNNGYYEGWNTAKSVEEQLRAIAKSYCPPSDNNCDYYNNVMSVINSYNLKKWDVKSNVSSNSNCGISGSTAGWSIRTIKPDSTDSSFTEMESLAGNSNRGQCVWYAKGRAFEIVNDLKSKGKLNDSQASHIKDLLKDAYGNGGDIYDNAKSVFNSSNNVKAPKAGSYIVWKKAGGYGHVAIIEEVNKDSNTITITEGYTSTGSCPDSWDCVQFRKRTMGLDDFYNGYGKYCTGGYEFSGYIYFLEPLDMKDIWGVSENNSVSVTGTGSTYCDNGVAVGGSTTMNYTNAVDVPDYLWKNYDGSMDPSIVIADEEGNVLAQRKARQRREGASTTKVFTGYAAVKLLDYNNDYIIGTDFAVRYAGDNNNNPVEAGVKYPISHVVTRAFPGSSNTGAENIMIAIGRKYNDCSSDEDAHKKGVKKVNEFLKGEGCTDSNLYDGSGLGLSSTTGHSAGDLVLITSLALKDPNFLNSFVNHSRCKDGDSLCKSYPNCTTLVQDRSKDGLFFVKSGTRSQGHGIWAFNKNGKRYYIAILGIMKDACVKDNLVSDVYNWAISDLVK